jgi:nitrile hydratase
MNGIHDMGGMHGFGPVVVEEHEPLFHAEWEARVMAINRFTRGQGFFNIDEFRHGIERMDPADYLRSSYYERWLATVVYNMTAKGYISAEELEARMDLLRREPDAVFPRPEQPTWSLPAARPADALDVAGAPRFAVGDAVVTHNRHPAGHTRLPRYARGRRGVIHQIHGAQIFPDSHAHGRGEDPQVLYSVRFLAQELWGDSAEPKQMLYLDLWEPYLRPAPMQG